MPLSAADPGVRRIAAAVQASLADVMELLIAVRLLFGRDITGISAFT